MTCKIALRRYNRNKEYLAGNLKINRSPNGILLRNLKLFAVICRLLIRIFIRF